MSVDRSPRRLRLGTANMEDWSSATPPPAMRPPPLIPAAAQFPLRAVSRSTYLPQPELQSALHRAETSGWSGWHDRAGHLSSGVPNLVAPSPRSSARDLSWETVVAAVCVNFCENVSFGEPDVLATFKGRPSAWRGR